MLESNQGTLKYKKLSAKEMAERRILGRLVGPVADFIMPTRNGRKYNEDLWEQVFNNDIMKEKLANKVTYGELGHPEGRTVIDPEKVAVCLAEQPRKNSKTGKLEAVFDILDTPNGRILKTLCDYGSILGISSRGEGDIITDELGEKLVDPDTYDCECWDVVIIPAVKEARLQYVTEGLNKNKKSLVESLKEKVENATPDDKRIMEKTLEELHIELEDEQEENQVGSEEKKTQKDNINDAKLTEATNDGTNELVKDLQEALGEKARLEARAFKLQERLAVSNSMVEKLNEEVAKYKNTTARLGTIAEGKKSLEKEVVELKEQLDANKETIARLSKERRTLRESKNNARIQLNEELITKDNEIKRLTESLNVKNEKINRLQKLSEDASKDFEIKVKESTERINKSEKLKEEYKKLAIDTAEKYIATKARMLGVTSNEVKNRLPESYTIEDVDRICESLQKQALSVNKLPFTADSSVKVRVNESKRSQVNVGRSQMNDSDDYVDESLINLANLN